MSLLSTITTDYLLVSNLFHFIFCIILMVYMRVGIENGNNSIPRHELKNFMLIVIGCLVADMLSYVFDTQSFPGAWVCNHICMFLSVLSTAFVGYWWNRFFDVLFHLRGNRRRQTFFYLLPTLLIGIALCINLPTGILYSIGPDNVYVRGDLYFVSFILQYISFVVVSLRALLVKIDVRTMRRRKMRWSVLTLGLVTLVFGILQAFAGGNVALHCFGITIGVFIIFLRFQDDQITSDSLTGLNNRYALDAYLVDKMQVYAAGISNRRRLYLIMMDVNNFKSINDLHGHMEGDHALKCVSDELRRVGAKHRSVMFVARFGGDEFAIVYETDSEGAVQDVCREVKLALQRETEDWKYWISIGAGYAVYAGKSMTISKFYAAADSALYIDKYGPEEGAVD